MVWRWSLVTGSGCRPDRPRNCASVAETRSVAFSHAALIRRCALSLTMLSLTGARASAADLQSMSGEAMAQHGAFAGVAIISGLAIFSMITALLHVFGRRRWLDREQGLVAALMEARAKLDRAEMFLAAERQIVIAWRSANEEPEIGGDLSLVTDAPLPRRILGFGSWLPPDAAQALDAAVDRLRARGEAFRMAVATKTGRHMEVDGRAIGGRAILRLRDVSGDRLELTRLREQHGRVVNECESIRQLLNAIPDPVWERDVTGRLSWANTAYARAVEARDFSEAIASGTELLDQQTREAASAARRDSAIWRARVPAVVAGERHMLNVIDVPGPAGSVGIAINLSELEAARGDLARQASARAQILDRLTTAVAIFDRNKRLQFHNAAYRAMWSLTPGFLDSKPFDGEILDKLRAEGKLPEQANFRDWKSGVLAGYQATETAEQIWYLPDSRRLRVVTSPNPDGGVIYLFDDTTERYQLESRFNALIRVQGETLDTLREGVAVFGTDGRIALFNPAFGTMWKIDQALLCQRPHINDLAAKCQALCQDPDDITHLRSVVAGLADERLTFERRIYRRDGMVLDCAAAPLPDGATLITFTDATDAVNIARVLTERNQVLIEAEQLRNDFVHHVSYELRSPLTNIIGFIALLGDRSVGELNEKQREYTGYILKSSAALLAIINDILDLATIDRDAMELSLGTVDIVETMEEASKGVQDRLADNGVTLNIVALDDIGSFRADAKRVRQILFNLLSNAIGFSEAGQPVTLAAFRRDETVIFKVTDQGRGIPMDMIDQVFGRFHSETIGTKHRGVGLGLSIVRSLMELHGGQVLIDSAIGEGTTVTCIFPARDAALAKSATS